MKVKIKVLHFHKKLEGNLMTAEVRVTKTVSLAFRFRAIFLKKGKIPKPYLAMIKWYDPPASETADGYERARIGFNSMSR